MTETDSRKIERKKKQRTATMANTICSSPSYFKITPILCLVYDRVLESEGWWEAWQPPQGNQEPLVVREKVWKTMENHQMSLVWATVMESSRTRPWLRGSSRIISIVIGLGLVDKVLEFTKDTYTSSADALNVQQNCRTSVASTYLNNILGLLP